MEVKECPRCGSNNISVTHRLYDSLSPYGTQFPRHEVALLVMVHCKDCGAAITRGSDEEAYRDWNNLYRPSAQMIAEGDCDGNCSICKGKEICWKE